jgi:hypothetical protein
VDRGKPKAKLQGGLSFATFLCPPKKSREAFIRKISGKLGDDAKYYQEKEVEIKIMRSTK